MKYFLIHSKRNKTLTSNSTPQIIREININEYLEGSCVSIFISAGVRNNEREREMRPTAMYYLSIQKGAYMSASRGKVLLKSRPKEFPIMGNNLWVLDITIIHP